jgi:cytochrome b involved in lipid metabolism
VIVVSISSLDILRDQKEKNLIERERASKSTKMATVTQAIVSLEELAHHNKKNDVWIAIENKG